MGWDANTKVLSLPFTKIAANGNGDLQKAVGRGTPRSEIQLIKDVDSNGNRVNAINKWARFKPIPRPNVSYADQLKTVDGKLVWKTISELTALSKVPWWIGSDGQCGLSFAKYSELGGTPQLITVSGKFLHDLLRGLPWTYNTPDGSSTEPLRAYDFNEYYHGAAKPLEGLDSSYQLTSNGTLNIQFVENRGYNDGYNDVALTLADFTINNVSVANFYAGLLIWYSNSLFTFVTSQSKISQGNLTCVFTGMASNYGGKDVQMVPFLSSVQISQGQDTQTGIFVSADVLPKTVHINSYVDDYIITIYAQWRDANYFAIDYEVKLWNNTNTAVSNETITLKVYRVGQTENIPQKTQTVSVPANGTAELKSSGAGWLIGGSSERYIFEVSSTHWNMTQYVDAPR